MTEENERAFSLKDAEEKLISEEQSSLDMGIGGVLILVAIGIVSGPFLQGYYLYQDLALVFDPQLSMTIQVIPPLKSCYVLAFVLDILLFALVCLLPFLFFTKKRLFPKVYIFTLIFALVYPAFSVGLSNVVGHLYLGTPFSFSGLFQGLDKGSLIRSAIKCCVWIPYMRISTRVKETFVR